MIVASDDDDSLIRDKVTHKLYFYLRAIGFYVGHYPSHRNLLSNLTPPKEKPVKYVLEGRSQNSLKTRKDASNLLTRTSAGKFSIGSNSIPYLIVKCCQILGRSEKFHSRIEIF